MNNATAIEKLPPGLRSRLIRKSDLVANKVAFIDYRIPGCTPKFNYALIGSGVAQGDKQFVNLAEPHGFGPAVALHDKPEHADENNGH